MKPQMMGTSVVCQDASTAKEIDFLKLIIPDAIFELLAAHDAVLAGGAISSLFSGRYINDFDIYSRDQARFDSLIKEVRQMGIIDSDHNSLSAFSQTMSLKRITNGTFGISADGLNSDACEHYGIEFDLSEHPFQFVYPDVACGSIDSILNTFDFTCVQAAFSFKSQMFYFHRNFLKDLAKRDLVYNIGRPHELSTQYRIEKYKKRGFTMDNFEMLKVTLSQNPHMVTTYGQLRKELRKVPGDPSMRVVRHYLHKIMTDKNPEVTKQNEAKKFDLAEFIDKLEEEAKFPIGDQSGFSRTREDKENMFLNKFYKVKEDNEGNYYKDEDKDIDDLEF